MSAACQQRQQRSGKYNGAARTPQLAPVDTGGQGSSWWPSLVLGRVQYVVEDLTTLWWKFYKSKIAVGSQICSHTCLRHRVSELEYGQRIANAAQASCDHTVNGWHHSERVTMWVKNAPQSHGNQAFWSDATAFWGKLFKFLVELRSFV